jgi:DNA primase
MYDLSPSDSCAARAAEIKSTISIEAVVGEYVPLRREGRQMKGCCPFHDDHNPSMYVDDQKGFYCFGCDVGGSVIDFVQKIENVSFNEACDMLENGFSPRSTRPQIRRDRSTKAEYALRIWRDALSIEGTPAELYLANRGLALSELPAQENLRFARLSLDGSAELYPALVAAVRTPGGEIRGIQRTYLTEDGKKLRDDGAKRSLGEISGNAIWLHLQPPLACGMPKHIHICEGLEDGLSMLAMTPPDEERYVWVCAGAGMMKNMVFPDGCKTVTIGIDNDKAGRASAEALSKRLVNNKVDVLIWSPDPQFKDFNEELCYWLNHPEQRLDESPWNFLHYHG